ncbi:heterokaryon incompatibility protein-domain-containing protein [Nemania sp. FL0031]|nr:heterokaryon incompatibility protein-domain-containing protein [Nemania sp. FL0031]
MGSCLVCRDLVPLDGDSGGFITGGRGSDLANATSDCQLCSILWEGLLAMCPQKPLEVQWIALKQVDDLFSLQFKHPTDELWMGVYFYTRDVNSPLSGIFKPGYDLEPDTSCDKYLAQAERWLRDCYKNHDQCKDQLSTTLPTRVLDVTHHEDFVFLSEPQETQTGSYVALSHTWGGDVPLQTTTRTFNLFKDGIRLDLMPQTFRDAVFMTRLLRCQYLWIDSLCIIQDSKEDWAWQATQMAAVYGNAHVTIAAVSSENSHSGLFCQHKPTEAKHTIMRTGGSGRDVIVDVRPILEHLCYYESMPYGLPPGARGSLLTRAWCFQEYLLSPRVLLFTDWEILWICRTRAECNCGFYSKDTRDIVNESELKIRFNRILRDGSNIVDISVLWGHIVKPYSQKDMTYNTDKLAALAGIASLFGKYLGRYINGLWEPTFIQDLFWRIDSSFVNSYRILTRRAEGSLVPSWSWASIIGPVDLYETPNTVGLELVDIYFHPGKLGSLASVSTRSLTLHGIFINARVWGGDKTDEHGYVAPARRLTADGITNAYWVVDVSTEVNCGPDEPINAYIICGRKSPGLVLAAVQESRHEPSITFKRLGIIAAGGLPVQRSHYATRTIQLI